MGRRGVSYHVRGMQPAERFESVEVPCAVLGSNEHWTSFAPLGDPPSGEMLARSLDAPVVTIWSDDDVGTTLMFATPGGWQAELPILLDVDPEPIGPADRDLLARLATEGIVTRAQAAQLAAQLAHGPHHAWLMRDGVETLLGVPFAEPLPVALTEASLLELEIAATLVRPAARRAGPLVKAKAVAPAAVTASVDEQVLALHVHYWVELFGMGSWKLYHRYKRHLPAERRDEVDELVTRVVTRSDRGEIKQAVAQILATIWTADDWDAAIRDPELVAFEPLDADQLSDWQRRLSAPATPAQGPP